MSNFQYFQNGQNVTSLMSGPFKRYIKHRNGTIFQTMRDTFFFFYMVKVIEVNMHDKTFLLSKFKVYQYTVW